MEGVAGISVEKETVASEVLTGSLLEAVVEAAMSTDEEVYADSVEVILTEVSVSELLTAGELTDVVKITVFVDEDESLGSLET